MPFRYYPEAGLDSDEAKTRSTVRALVDKHIRPTIGEDDRTSQFRRSTFEVFAREGFGAIFINAALGGKGLGYESYYAAIEEVARGSVSLAITLGVNHLPQGALVQFGNPDQIARYSKRFGSGELLGAFSLSEPNAGSDATGLILAAKRDGKGYVLNGTKAWCSTAGFADLYLVMARTGPDRSKGITAFLLEKDTSGFRVGKQEKKMGLCASPLGELIFENCQVPDSQRIGEEGMGMKVALSQLDGGRVVIGVIGLAIAKECLERLWSLGKKEGESLAPGWQARSAYWYARAQALHSVVHQVALSKNRGEPITALAAQIKLLGSDLAMEVSSGVVEALGTRGVLREYEVERLLRDAKALQIVEGTNQIQQLVLAREMEAMQS